MVASLVVHRDGQSASAADLQSVVTPDRTASWCPIPHHRLLTDVHRSLAEAGYRVETERHALAKDGQRYFGILDVRHSQGAVDYGLVIGVRNSHDKSFPAGLCLGSRVFVCDNLAFSSEIVISRRHTSMIERDLPGLVMKAVGRLTDARGLQDTRIAAYKDTPLSDMEAHDLLVRAVDARALPIRWLGDTLREWRTPRHPEFTRDGKNVWRLFNAVTEALKPADVQALPRRTQVLHGLLDSLCGVPLQDTARPIRRVEAVAIAA